MPNSKKNNQETAGAAPDAKTRTRRRKPSATSGDDASKGARSSSRKAAPKAELTPADVENQLLKTLLARVGSEADFNDLLREAGLTAKELKQKAWDLRDALAARSKAEPESTADQPREVRPRTERPMTPQPLAVPIDVQIGAEYEGKLEITREGIARVLLPVIGEIQLPSPSTLKAMPEDTLLVRIDGVYRGKVFGSIVRVVKRARTEFVGTLEYNGGKTASFIPQWNKIRHEFVIPKAALKGAHSGEKVLARITSWSGPKPVGEIVEVLGEAGTHLAEMHAIVLEFGIDTAHDPEAVAEANAFPETLSKKDLAKRRDFRQVTTFTIDPDDAKDFDDALSFERLPNGTMEVGVHIADVTHYVKEGTALDRDAYERATSVYLVDRTIPMLPERLSNNLCSLVPNKDRPVFSAVFTMAEDGHILNRWFGRGVIHSDRRFSYEEAQKVLETGQGDYSEELLTLNRLAHILRKERFAAGSVNFETEEVKFKLDDQYRPVAVYRKERKDAHKLIEDFMLLANREVAEFVAKARSNPSYPMVYRIHDIPNEQKLETLRKFVAGFGYRMDVSDKRQASRSLNRLVLEVMGKPEENLIQTIAIRSMPKAIYTTVNSGHYGLGFEFYTHFTSPIRRYPDVLAHRILQQVLDGKVHVDEIHLEEMCRHSSDREKRAADAERASIKYKQVEYLQGMLGQEAEGMVSGVTEWGMYVELEGNKCEGMVPLREMRDDHYDLDEQKYRLVGRRTGRTFQLGDRVKVRVKKTNLVKRTADFTYLEKLPPKPPANARA